MRPNSLLLEHESEWLDFKAQFHSETLTLIHDILCLANSYTDNNKYLVFGIEDNKTVRGVESDPNRKRNAEIQDLLRQSNFNRIPTVTLRSYSGVQGHAVDVLEIRNRPDKPFFLIKDKQGAGKVIRAGVVYTRVGDTNIPLKETAPEDHIELMWRERFGLGLDPLSRLLKLLDDDSSWVTVHGDSYIYHKMFPEFTICDGEQVCDNFVEPWTQNFPNPKASSYYVECRYLTTILKKALFVTCDGGRYSVPAPSLENGTWIIDTSSLEWKIAKIYQQYLPLPTALPSKGVILV